MSSQIRFVIPGRVAGKGRSRATIRRGKVTTYTPDKTRSAEGVVRHFAQEAMRGRQRLEGAVSLTIRAYFIPPKSWSRKRREAAVYVTGTPDVDNTAKLAADSCNNIVWKDDSQIAVLHFERWYTLTGPERVEITVHDLSAAPFVRLQRAAA